MKTYKLKPVIVNKASQINITVVLKIAIYRVGNKAYRDAMMLHLSRKHPEFNISQIVHQLQGISVPLTKYMYTKNNQNRVLPPNPAIVPSKQWFCTTSTDRYICQHTFGNEEIPVDSHFNKFRTQ